MAVGEAACVSCTASPVGADSLLDLPAASLTLVDFDDRAWKRLHRDSVRMTAMRTQCRLARLIESDRAPTNIRLTAQVASRLNQLRETNLRPR
jgi:hypothetical protein